MTGKGRRDDSEHTVKKRRIAVVFSFKGSGEAAMLCKSRWSS